MKTTNTIKRLLNLSFTAGALTFPLTIFAATQYSSNPTNWDNGTTAKWSSLSGGPYTSFWTNGNDAVFEGTAGTVNIGAGGVNARNINFTVNSYQVSAQTLTLSGSVPTITVGNGLSTKITSALAGSAGLTKAGGGILDLEGTPSWTGGTFIKEGTLAIGASNDRLPTGGTVTLGDVSSSGTLQLGYVNTFGKNQTLAGLLATGNGGSVVPVSGGAVTLTLNISSGTNTFSGTLGGAATQRNLALVKTGNGTLELTGSNTYTNATTISAGALNITTASTGGGSFTNNATFGVSIAGAGQSLKMSSLTLGANALNFTLGVSNPTAPVITNVGALTLNGTVNVNVFGGASLTASDVTLIAYASGGAGTFAAGTLPTVSGYATVLTNDTSNKQLKLIFLAAATPPSPTNITYSVTGNQLILNWPAGQSLQLQAQTNNLNMGLTTNWATISGATPPFTNPINPANPSLFYRLLYATGNPPTTFTVTYSGNGNTGGSAPSDGNSPYAGGATVTVLSAGSLTKTGSTFAGWNTAADGSGTGYSAGNTFSIASNTTLYAQWTALPAYTVTYNGNGNNSGSAPSDGNSPYASGSSVTVLGANSLAKTGYAFAGWNTAANGGGASFTPGNGFVIASNTTLYAQWNISAATYTVTYSGNGSTGGTVPNDPGSPYAVSAVVTVLGNTGNLTNAGYAFAGWNTAPNGVGTSFNAGNTFIIASNTMLYAQWSLIASFQYSYAPYNQTNMDPQLTGWPISVAESNHITTYAEYQRYPGKETAPGQTGVALWDLVAQTPNTQSGSDGWYIRTTEVTVRPILTNQTPLDILLVGDSITSQWGGGQMGAFTTNWLNYYSNYPTINLGIGGDRTSSVLWRLDHAGFEHLVAPPKVCVLQIGNNNQYLNAQGVTYSSCVQGVVWCLKNLRSKFPGTPIIWVNIFPQVNGAIFLKNYHDLLNTAGITNPASTNFVSNVTALDLWDKYSSNGTNGDAVFFYDGTHPSAIGYQLWATNMLPLVQQLVGH